MITLLDYRKERMLAQVINCCGNLSSFNGNVVFHNKALQESLDEYCRWNYFYFNWMLEIFNNKQLELFVIVLKVLFALVFILYKIFKAH